MLRKPSLIFFQTVSIFLTCFTWIFTAAFAFTTSGVGADNSTVTNVSKVNMLATNLAATYDATAIEGFYLASFTNTPADESLFSKCLKRVRGWKNTE